MVDGEIVCRDGVIVKMPDHGKVVRECETIAKRMLNDAGLQTRLEPAWRLHNIGR
jgi:hypothetical protein